MNIAVENTLRSIDNVDRLTDLAAISIYNTSHEAIDKFDVMQEFASPDYVEGEFVQESLLTGVLIGAGILGVAISAFLIIKKIIESKAKGDPNAASNTVAGVNLLNPDEVGKLFDEWDNKYFKKYPDLVAENVPGVGELGAYNGLLLEAIRGFCGEATHLADTVGSVDDAQLKEGIAMLEKEFDNGISMDEILSKMGRVDKNNFAQIKSEAMAISKTLKEFDNQVARTIDEFKVKAKEQNTNPDGEENKQITEESIKFLEKTLKAKADTAGKIMQDFRTKCLDGIGKALETELGKRSSSLTYTDDAKNKKYNQAIDKVFGPAATSNKDFVKNYLADNDGDFKGCLTTAYQAMLEGKAKSDVKQKVSQDLYNKVSQVANIMGYTEELPKPPFELTLSDASNTDVAEAIRGASGNSKQQATADSAFTDASDTEVGRLIRGDSDTETQTKQTNPDDAFSDASNTETGRMIQQAMGGTESPSPKQATSDSAFSDASDTEVGRLLRGETEGTPESKAEEKEVGDKQDNTEFENKVKVKVSKAVDAGIDERAAELIARGDAPGIASALGKFNISKPEAREQYIVLYDNLNKALDFFGYAPLKQITENGIDKFMTPDQLNAKYGEPSQNDSAFSDAGDTEVGKLLRGETDETPEAEKEDTEETEPKSELPDAHIMNKEEAEKVSAKPFAPERISSSELNSNTAAEDRAKQIGAEDRAKLQSEIDRAKLEAQLKAANNPNAVLSNANDSEAAAAIQNQLNSETSDSEDEHKPELTGADENIIQQISANTGFDESRVENIYNILKANTNPEDVKHAFIANTFRPIISMPGFNQNMANKSLETNYDYFKTIADAAKIPFDVQPITVSNATINDIYNIINNTNTDTETKIEKIADQVEADSEAEEPENEILNAADTTDTADAIKEKYSSAIDELFPADKFSESDINRVKKHIIEDHNGDLNEYLNRFYASHTDKQNKARYRRIAELAKKIGYTEELPKPTNSPS